MSTCGSLTRQEYCMKEGKDRRENKERAAKQRQQGRRKNTQGLAGYKTIKEQSE